MACSFKLHFFPTVGKVLKLFFYVDENRQDPIIGISIHRLPLSRALSALSVDRPLADIKYSVALLREPFWGAGKRPARRDRLAGAVVCWRVSVAFIRPFASLFSLCVERRPCFLLTKEFWQSRCKNISCFVRCFV